MIVKDIKGLLPGPYQCANGPRGVQLTPCPATVWQGPLKRSVTPIHHLGLSQVLNWAFSHISYAIFTVNKEPFVTRN